VVLFVKLPNVPVTVTVTVPGCCRAAGVRVSVLVLAVPLLGVLVGLNEAVTPLGRRMVDKTDACY